MRKSVYVLGALLLCTTLVLGAGPGDKLTPVQSHSVAATPEKVKAPPAQAEVRLSPAELKEKAIAAQTPVASFNVAELRNDLVLCPVGSLYGATPHDPNASWTFGVSDTRDPNDPTYSSLIRYESFSGISGNICDIHWWGLSLSYPWAACTETPAQFEIKFYLDAGGQPGAEVCSYTVTPTVTPTGVLYSGFNMNRYDVLSLSPCCQLAAGWVSIQGITVGNPDCWFLWASSPTGNGSSKLLDQGTGVWTTEAFDLAFCLTGEYIPIYGACCSDYTGVCQDNVEMINCLPPARFVANGVCAQLDPPCGILGACCNAGLECVATNYEADCDALGGHKWYAGQNCANFTCPAECQHRIELWDSYGDGWNGNTLDVFVNGVPVLTGITLASGAGPLSFYFDAATGDTITTVYNAIGGWPYEPYYYIFDGNGVQIGADGLNGTMPTGITVTGNCQVVLAACCINGQCSMLTQPACAAANGLFFPGEDCATFQCPAGCQHRVELWDSFGDGWNGNTLDVYVNGSPVLSGITLTSGSGPVNYYFLAADGDVITTVYNAIGGWPYEPYYYIFDGLGFQIAADGLNNTVPAGVTATGRCTPPQDGACCFYDGTCQLTLPADCPAGLAEFLGIGSTCSQCPCFVLCPPGGVDEGEPCGTDTNGGCNSTPAVFGTIACGETICGTAWATGGTRDTDWFEIVTTEPAYFTWTVEAEFPVLIFIINGGSGNCSDFTILSNTTAPVCTPATLTTADCMLPGRYWFWVGPSQFDGLPCTLDYKATLTCEPCSTPLGACCVDGACVATNQQWQCANLGGMWFAGQDCATFQCPGGCAHTVQLWDSYGDGWNGNTLDVYVNAVLVLDDITLPSGAGPLNVQFPAGDGDVITTVYNATGGWPYEPYYYIFDGLGFQIAADGLNNTTPVGVTAIGRCTPPTTGACCFYDGTCQLTLPADCPAGQAEFLGIGSTCAQCPCFVLCPPGSVDEGEPCGTDTNGGCNSTPPIFGAIACGETICGTAWANGSMRDTDWYIVNYSGSSIFTITAKAEFPLQLLLIEDAGNDCVGYTYTIATGAPCQEVTITTQCLPPGGVYYVWVGPSSFSGVTCGANDTYWVRLDCAPCSFPGACCIGSTCVEGLLESQCLAQGGRFLGEGTNCGVGNYEAAMCSNAFEDISGTGTPLTLGDDQGIVVPIGFSFSFFGSTKTNIGVCSNGYLTFGGVLTDYTEDPIPNTAQPNDLIAVLWDDLNPGVGGSVHYQTLGTAPNRRFIAQWTNVPQYGNSDSNTFQAVLFEGTNCIELRYGTCTLPAGDYQAGVENADGTVGLSVTSMVAVGACIEICYVPAENPCLCGDIDGDGDVDVDDYWLFVDAYGTCVGHTKYNQYADMDGSGCINLVDYTLWLECYYEANGRQFVPPKKKKVSVAVPLMGGLQPAGR